MIAGVVIPAAGLGTRLRPLTDTCPKEMLPVGGRPLIAASLLEVVAARVDRAVVVVSPGKESLREWLTERAPASLDLRFAVQAEARGVLDAVDRGARLLPPGPYAVLYPDYVHVPDQRGLAELLRHADPARGSTFAMLRMTRERASRFGATARVTLAGEREGARTITHVEAGQSPREGAFHTLFAEVRGAAHLDALARGPLDDARGLGLLGDLAREGSLYGVELTGDVLDLGTRVGYEHAVARFDAGARWRDAP